MSFGFAQFMVVFGYYVQVDTARGVRNPRDAFGELMRVVQEETQALPPYRPLGWMSAGRVIKSYRPKQSTASASSKNRTKSFYRSCQVFGDRLAIVAP